MTFETEFDKFLKKWTGNFYAHLVDTDENDGQKVRDYVEDNYLPKRKVKIILNNGYLTKEQAKNIIIWLGLDK